MTQSNTRPRALGDRRTSRTAATLAEVTATVVTLLVLSIWLLPALAGVAKSSKNSKCLANLMRIGYANSVYAAQDMGDMAIPVHRDQFNQDLFSPTYIGAYEWGGKSGIGRADFVPEYAGHPLGSKYGTVAGFGPARRPINPILYKDDFVDHGQPGDPEFDRIGAQQDTHLELDVHRCPADTGFTGIHCPSFAEMGLTSYDHFGTSYNANVFMISPGGGGQMYSNSPYLHRMSDILSPETTIAYQENNGRFAWNAAPYKSACLWIGWGFDGPVRGWHGKDWTFNTAFVDGHADTIYMRGFDMPVLGRYPPLGTSEGSWDHYRCIIIRGEGWQVDTLPADFVPTGLYHRRGGRSSWEGCL